MEVTVTGRHLTVSEKLRDHLDEKLAKIEQLDPKVSRVDVVVTHEPNHTESERVEITCWGKRTVIRAEASSDDRYAAVDAAAARLTERVRRAHEKRAHRNHAKVPAVVPDLPADLVGGPPAPVEEPVDRYDIDPYATAEVADEIRKIGGDESCPVTLREKVHVTAPMTVDEALGYMEGLGHDFFFFFDSETQQPSVVYCRRGWSYGVLRLEVLPAGVDTTDPEAVAVARSLAQASALVS